MKPKPPFEVKDLLHGLDGTDRPGQVCVVIGTPVFIGQWWIPVLWENEEDPDFWKASCLEWHKIKTDRLLKRISTED